MAALADVTVAILAGGAGTRFGGRDKGLIEVGGKPLVAWAVDAIPAACPRLIVANRHHDAYAPFARVVGDELPGHRGPALGIRAALRAARTQWVATVPVDCPRPPHDWLQRLLDFAVLHNAIAAVAHDGDRREPLFALYRRALVDADALAADAAVWAWQDRLPAREVDLSDVADGFANLNDEAARLAFERQLAHA